VDSLPQASAGSARDRLIVALDYPDMSSALKMVDALDNAIQWYKVGLELYLGAGAGVVSALTDRGYSVFVDLKLHDIPNTVAAAVRSVGRTSASLLTIHAAGGPAMIAAAVDAAAGLSNRPKVLAVTVLTSVDQAQLSAIGISASPAEQVERLAAMAIANGADGLVCSAEETASLRASLGPQPLLVTPGIRPVGSAANDQKRMATPAGALRNGASYLVVGRPITQAAEPKNAAEGILAEMQSALT
jgi:orotidine-5'-phosphate decarboxylase